MGGHNYWYTDIDRAIVFARHDVKFRAGVRGQAQLWSGDQQVILRVFDDQREAVKWLKHNFKLPELPRDVVPEEA